MSALGSTGQMETTEIPMSKCSCSIWLFLGALLENIAIPSPLKTVHLGKCTLLPLQLVSQCAVCYKIHTSQAFPRIFFCPIPAFLKGEIWYKMFSVKNLVLEN